MIYLDYQATTPVAAEAAAAMRPWLDDKFANPHSPNRRGGGGGGGGGAAGARVGEGPGGGENLLSPGGATGAANGARRGGGARRIVTLATEHACVLDTVEWL